MKLSYNQENFINNIMGWTFSQITAKRAAIRQLGFGVPKTPGLKTFDQLMNSTNATASPTILTQEETPDGNLTTINGDNLVRIDGNNLVRIS